MTLFSQLSPRARIGAGLMLLLGLLPIVAHFAGQMFYVTLFARILIYALAAVSLNFILGFGGMVSLGHALYLGVGAYAVGILSFYGITNGWLHVLAALVVAALIAALTGLVVLRTSGIAFIMITLAFAQMFFFFVVGLKMFGGDDGMSIDARSNFGFELNTTGIYYIAFALLALAIFATTRIMQARFGMVLQGAKYNPRRLKALGFGLLRYQLAAYILAAMVCALAGVLLANLTKFATPEYMAWMRSGELIVMVVLGGLGSAFGPVVGAVALLLTEEILAALTVHWMIILGPLIVIIVLTTRQGLLSYFSDKVKA